MKSSGWEAAHAAGRDAEPNTTAWFLVGEDRRVRATVWRWRGYERWSWSAVDREGNYYEDRPEAPDARLFDTVEEAKEQALIVAGIDPETFEETP